MILSAGMRLGPYEVLAPLGTGGMGEVYKARDTRLSRDVAIKVLPARLSSNPEIRARFEHEARTISQLNDPHICTLYDIGTTSSPHAGGEATIDYLVMEYLEGQTLAARLARGTTLTREFANTEGIAWSPDGREIWFSAAADSARAEPVCRHARRSHANRRPIPIERRSV